MSLSLGDKNGFNGFEDFMFKNILPACFIAPMKPSFDLSDGQTVCVSSQFVLLLTSFCSSLIYSLINK